MYIIYSIRICVLYHQTLVNTVTHWYTCTLIQTDTMHSNICSYVYYIINSWHLWKPWWIRGGTTAGPWYFIVFHVKVMVSKKHNLIITQNWNHTWINIYIDVHTNEHKSLQYILVCVLYNICKFGRNISVLWANNS